MWRFYIFVTVLMCNVKMNESTKLLTGKDQKDHNHNRNRPDNTSNNTTTEKKNTNKSISVREQVQDFNMTWFATNVTSESSGERSVRLNTSPNDQSSSDGSLGDLMTRLKRKNNLDLDLDLSKYYDFQPLSNDTRPLIDGLLPEDGYSACGIMEGKYKIVDVVTTTPLIRLECHVRKHNKLDFLSFRNFTSGLKNADLDFAIDITCVSGTVISLPWPFRARLLRYISVKNCDIKNYKSEFYDKTLNSISDTLEYVRLKNIRIVLSMKSILEQAINPRMMTEAADCGPLNAYAIIMRNVTHTFDLSKTIPMKRHFPVMSQKIKKMFRNLSLVKYTCTYKNMWLLEKSSFQAMAANSDIFEMHNARFPKLEVLNLSHNSVKEIPDKLKDWRLLLPALRHLDLSHNIISELPILKDYGAEWENPNIGTIDLKHNNISSLSPKSISGLLQARYFKVDLRDNPFRCGCEMKNFVNLIQNKTDLKAINSTFYGYLKDLTCNSPADLKGRKISNLSHEALGCHVSITTILKGPIITISVFVTILMVLSLLVVRYKKEITILAFTRLRIIFPCQNGSSGEKKEYDAFIAYSQNDTEWVLRTLVPRLENKNNVYNFKVCLHHRDFELGAPISDNIIKSVESSRHTVLIISKQFLKSEWCLLEFRTALQQSLLEKKRHLVMILLEDIPTEDIDRDIKRCLQTLTYVKTDDRWFWDKLVYALSDKTRIKRQKI